MPELPEDPPGIRVADRAVLLRAIEIARQRVATETMRAFEMYVIQGLDLATVAKLLRIPEARFYDRACWCSKSHSPIA